MHKLAWLSVRAGAGRLHRRSTCASLSYASEGNGPFDASETTETTAREVVDLHDLPNDHRNSLELRARAAQSHMRTKRLP
jgi:hypothetical protein